MTGSIRAAPAEAAMCSVQYLRDFIKERLNAACEEIFSEVQKTIVHYEEEISRQRRLLDISRKPDTHSHITDHPKQHDCEEEEGLDEQQVCNQERNFSLDQEDPEPPQIKEAQDELCSSQKGEHLGLKQEPERLIIWTDEEQLSLLKNIWKPEIASQRPDHVCEEEDFLTEKQVCNQGRNSSLDQEEPPQMKKEQEELCSSQEGEQLGLKQEAETFLVTPTYKNSNHSEEEPNSGQFLSHRSPEAESRNLKERQHVDSGSTRNAELKKMKRRHHSERVDNTPVSESQRQTDTKEKSVLCDTCGRTFQNKSKLKTHLRIHTGEKPHCCKTCGKRFNQKSDLERHIRTHTGEKPYVCSTCGKGFVQTSELQRHIRSHTGEKPHCCITCGKRFADTTGVIKHMRIHTGEKPYSCSICGKRFSWSSVLERHTRTHTKERPLSCKICGKRFSQSAHLNKHMRIHAGSKLHA